ncbi:MAG: DUF4359 domain-containing protein [Phormidesmis sp.]
MKKTVPSLALLFLLALAVALLVTNPNEEDYAQYLSQTVAEQTKGSLCQPEGFSKWLGKVGEAMSQACQGIINGGESLSKEDIQQLIITNTEYHNRFIFSTYITQSPIGNYRAIGVFNRFFLSEQPKG